MGNFDRLRDHWRAADFETRFDIGLTLLGLGLMLYAVVAQFGSMGVVFIAGMWLHKMGRM